MRLFDGGVTLGGVAGVSFGQLDCIDSRFGLSNSAHRLQATNSTTGFLAHQPVAGWHRTAIAQQRRIAYDNRVARVVDDNDLEMPFRFPPE